MMCTRKLLVATVLATASAVTSAGLAGEARGPQPMTCVDLRVPFLHGLSSGQLGGQTELASLERADEWLNLPPLTAPTLRDKVVLVDFWTYTCINRLRALPYVRAWAEKYRDQGLVASEFGFENIG